LAQAFPQVSEQRSRDVAGGSLSETEALRALFLAACPAATRSPHTDQRISGRHRGSVAPTMEALDPALLTGSAFAEARRPARRTVYMHKEWEKHRSSARFITNLQTWGESGVQKALAQELSLITVVSLFVVGINLLLGSYTDLAGVSHAGPLAFIGANLAPVYIPMMAFSTASPALALLITFRCNTAYSRWNEARTLWGGVVNNCRNVVRQANLFFPEDAASKELKETLAANTAGFAKALRNFLRGPDDDETFRSELMDLANEGFIPMSQVDACMAAKNRPMFMLNAMSNGVRKAKIGTFEKASIDRSISTLVDLTGACERIFKSPIPLVYTRHTSRFLILFLLLLPFGLWKADSSWNHWLTIPMADVISFLLLGIEELGIQLEEPFSVLPLEALCNGAIAATLEELLFQKEEQQFDFSRN